jgi:hypothetical protein
LSSVLKSREKREIHTEKKATVIISILNAVKGLSVATCIDYLQNKILTVEAGQRFIADFQTNKRENETNNDAFWKLFSFSKTELVILVKIINNLPTAVAAFSSPVGDSESSSKFLHQIN